MLAVLLSVVVISISGVMMPGPMFAVTLAKSYKSMWAGTMMSFGHAVIEVPLILLIYFGFARFFSKVPVQFVLSLLGGGMIVWMGLGMFRARKEIAEKGKDLPYNAFVAGILMSGLNPFFLLWWATVGGMLIMKITGYGTMALVALIVVHWLCDFVWLSLVSITINKTHSLWKKGIQEMIFVACSLLLVGFGGWFIFSGIRIII